MLRLFASALVALALTGAALAALGGPAPGVSVGWDGAVDASSAVRYVALPAAGTTTIAAVADERRASAPLPHDPPASSGSRSWRSTALPKASPATAGRSCLRTWRPARTQTHFAVLRTATFRVAKTFTLPGRWAYDALSPDGRVLFRHRVPRHGREPALSDPLRQPRQRQAVRRLARGQARAGRGDERGTVGTRAQRERRLGATRSTRSRTAPRFVHALDPAERRRVLHRSAAGGRPRSASPPCVCRSRTAGRTLELDETGREPARRRRHDDIQSDRFREAVARRPRERPRSPSRSPRRPRRCRGWR